MARRNCVRASDSQARSARTPPRRGSSAPRTAAGKSTGRRAPRAPRGGRMRRASADITIAARVKPRMIRNDIDWVGLRASFEQAQPFSHVVIDDFFLPEIAEALETDIPPFNHPSWSEYSNPIEEKRALNHWDRF